MTVKRSIHITRFILLNVLITASFAYAQQAPPQPNTKGHLLLQLTDDAGKPVSGATAMLQEDWSDVKTLNGLPAIPQMRPRTRQGNVESPASDRQGNLTLPFLTVFAIHQVAPTRTKLLIIQRDRKLGTIVEFSPGDMEVVQPVKLHPLVYVHGTLASPDMTAAGHVMNRALVRATVGTWQPPIAECISDQSRFGFLLPAGSYTLTIGAGATDGSTYQPSHQDIAIDAAKSDIDLGEIELGQSTTTQLLGKPAPLLDGLIDWRNGSPLTIDQLRGKVVILDFWSYTCSICLESMPDLFRVQQKYAKNPDVVIIAVHNATSPTLDDAYAKSAVARKRIWGGTEFPFRVALDDGRMFRAYGISGIPATIMIGRDGNVARRLFHAGTPGFDQEIDTLLSAGNNPGGAVTAPPVAPIAKAPPATAPSGPTTQSAEVEDGTPKAAVRAYFRAIVAGDADAAKALAFCDDAAARSIDATIAERAAKQKWIAAVRQKFGDAAANKLDVDVDAMLLKEVDRLDVRVSGDTADIGSHGDYPCRLVNGRWRYDLIQLHQNDGESYFNFDEQAAKVHEQFASEITADRWKNLAAMVRAHSAAMPKPPSAVAAATRPSV